MSGRVEFLVLVVPWTLWTLWEQKLDFLMTSKQNNSFPNNCLWLTNLDTFLNVSRRYFAYKKSIMETAE